MTVSDIAQLFRIIKKYLPAEDVDVVWKMAQKVKEPDYKMLKKLNSQHKTVEIREFLRVLRSKIYELKAK